MEGSRENALEIPSDDSVSMATNNDALQERKLPIVYEDIAADIDKQNSNSVKRVNKKKRSKQKDQSTQGDPITSTNTDKQVGKTPELLGQDVSRSDYKDSSDQVVILGDSMIKNIQGWRLKRGRKNEASGEFHAAHMFIYMFFLYGHSSRYLVVR